MEDRTCWSSESHTYQTREGRTLGDDEGTRPPPWIPTNLQLVPDEADVFNLQGQMPPYSTPSLGHRNRQTPNLRMFSQRLWCHFGLACLLLDKLVLSILGTTTVPLFAPPHPSERADYFLYATKGRSSGLSSFLQWKIGKYKKTMVLIPFQATARLTDHLL